MARTRYPASSNAGINLPLTYPVAPVTGLGNDLIDTVCRSCFEVV
ncbi:hypothetical protein D1BOALGB6SA_947 [Olavius sp. associated proteobacterium Delta 1]|nr:hypothetical protein D1BOALGB6SA_947 [Olavius sp. associated proteobacterium Delta 1]